MRNISPFLIYAVYLTIIIIAESYIFSFLVSLGISNYRAEKLRYIIAAILLFLFYILARPGETKIFARPSARELLFCLLFSTSLSIAGIAMISNQIYLTALFSPDKAFTLWNFTGAKVNIGPDSNYLGQNSGLLNTSLFIFTQTMLMPFMEEMYFRGLILKGLTQKYSVIFSVFITSVLFAIPHPANQHLTSFMFSILVCFYFLQTKNLVLVGIIHGLSNLIDWLFSGFGGMSYIESRTKEELPLITTWLPEIIISLACYAFCIYVIRSKINVIQLSRAQQPPLSDSFKTSESTLP